LRPGKDRWAPVGFSGAVAVTDMITQAASAEEAAILSDLGRRTFTQTFGHLYGPEDLALFLEKSHCVAAYEALIADASRIAWIARDQSAMPVGFVTATPCDLPVPDRPASAGELQRLYILQGRQGRGLGVRLMTLALDWLDARFEHIYVSVYAENHGAQRLYARHGFEKVHEYFYMVGNQADPEYIMKRTPGGGGLKAR